MVAAAVMRIGASRAPALLDALAQAHALAAVLVDEVDEDDGVGDDDADEHEGADDPGTSSRLPVRTSMAIAPVAAKGTETSRMSGWTRELKVAP